MFERFLVLVEGHPYGSLITGATIGTLIAYVIKGVVSVVLNIYKKDQHEEDFMLDQCNKSINVQAMLMSFAGASRAKTISVCRFRNGKHYFDATPIMYVDITEEGVVPNMNRTKKVFHGQYVNDMVVELRDMIEGSAPLRIYKKDLDKDNPFCEYMDTTKLQMLVIYKLKIKKQVIGFVMMGFDEILEENECLMQAGTLEDDTTHAIKKRKCNYSCEGCQFRNYVLNIQKEIELSKSV